MPRNVIYLIVCAICVALCGFVAWGGGQGGATHSGYSVFLICALIAFFVNWLAFIPANLAKTEKYYDFTGMLTYLSMMITAFALTPDISLRGKIALAMVTIWTLRLGLFLFSRIMRDGKDSRFDIIKPYPLRFFMTWTLQATWAVLTAACALAMITGGVDKPLGIFAYIGIAVWALGFLIEVIADNQKSKFKKDKSNEGKFITTGLWAWSRHPNYFGEITLWTGIAIMAIPVLSGWQWVVMISPVFVFYLLTRVSGVNKLEDAAEKKWGDDPSWQAYKAKTPELMMKPPSK